MNPPLDLVVPDIDIPVPRVALPAFALVTVPRGATDVAGLKRTESAIQKSTILNSERRNISRAATDHARACNMEPKNALAVAFHPFPVGDLSQRFCRARPGEL